MLLYIYLSTDLIFMHQYVQYGSYKHNTCSTCQIILPLLPYHQNILENIVTVSDIPNKGNNPQT